jgi:hypothetical protein
MSQRAARPSRPRSKRIAPRRAECYQLMSSSLQLLTLWAPTGWRSSVDPCGVEELDSGVGGGGGRVTAPPVMGSRVATPEHLWLRRWRRLDPGTAGRGLVDVGRVQPHRHQVGAAPTQGEHRSPMAERAHPRRNGRAVAASPRRAARPRQELWHWRRRAPPLPLGSWWAPPPSRPRESRRSATAGEGGSPAR